MLLNILTVSVLAPLAKCFLENPTGNITFHNIGNSVIYMHTSAIVIIYLK